LTKYRISAQNRVRPCVVANRSLLSASFYIWKPLNVTSKSIADGNGSVE